MPLYTFYPCQLDQTALCFEAQELEDDAAATRFCFTVLDQHPTAEFVVAWCGERRVTTRQRLDASLASALCAARTASTSDLEA